MYTSQLTVRLIKAIRYDRHRARILIKPIHLVRQRALGAEVLEIAVLRVGKVQFLVARVDGDVVEGRELDAPVVVEQDLGLVWRDGVDLVDGGRDGRALAFAQEDELAFVIGATYKSALTGQKRGTCMSNNSIRYARHVAQRWVHRSSTSYVTWQTYKHTVRVDDLLRAIHHNHVHLPTHVPRPATILPLQSLQSAADLAQGNLLHHGALLQTRASRFRSGILDEEYLVRRRVPHDGFVEEWVARRAGNDSQGGVGANDGEEGFVVYVEGTGEEGGGGGVGGDEELCGGQLSPVPLLLG